MMSSWTTRTENTRENTRAQPPSLVIMKTLSVSDSPREIRRLAEALAESPSPPIMRKKSETRELQYEDQCMHLLSQRYRAKVSIVDTLDDPMVPSELLPWRAESPRRAFG